MDFLSIDLTPYVTLDAYKGIRIPLKQLEVEIALAVQLYNKGKYEKIKSSDRTVREGDIICVDYKGILNGTAFSGGTAADQMITVYEGTGYIDGFASGFIGATVGAPSSFDVTFPENYGAAELAGKTVTFEFTVDYIVGTETLTDTLASELSNGAYPTVEQFMRYQRNLLVQAELWQTIVDRATVKSYPTQQVEYYYRQFRAMYEGQAKYYGISYESYIQILGISDADLREQAMLSVREDLVYYSILREESLTLTDAEFEAQIDSYVKRYKEEFGYTDEQIEESMPSIRENMLYDKVQELLISWAEIIVS
jgi:trigger factor